MYKETGQYEGGAEVQSRAEQSRAAPGAECRAGSDEVQKSGAEVLVVQR